MNNRAQVGLTQLEQKAAASQALYDAYLNRFKETSTQEGTEQSGARIVSRADVPSVQSAPKVGLYLVFGAILAVGAGLGSIFVGEVLDTGLMTSDDVERRLGIPYLGRASTVEINRAGSQRDAGRLCGRPAAVAVRRNVSNATREPSDGRRGRGAARHRRDLRAQRRRQDNSRRMSWADRGDPGIQERGGRL